jgi:hypothetical protein
MPVNPLNVSDIDWLRQRLNRRQRPKRSSSATVSLWRRSYRLVRHDVSGNLFLTPWSSETFPYAHQSGPRDLWGRVLEYGFLTRRRASNEAAPTARACTFQTLSPAEKSRYQSRCRRRGARRWASLRDQWLRQQICITPEECRALRPPTKGENCRAVSRPVTSMDGSMTVGIGRKCD